MTESWAAGAFAIGKCGAYGQAYDYAGEADARAAARKQCKGDCPTTLTMKRACAAFAVDMTNPCGAHGYAVKPQDFEFAQRGDAQMLRIRRQGMRDPRLGLRRQGVGVNHRHSGGSVSVEPEICDCASEVRIFDARE